MASVSETVKARISKLKSEMMLLFTKEYTGLAL